MSEQISRRETLRRGLAAASLLALVPEWAMPAPAEGETDIPFTDYPANYNPNSNPAAANRFLDIRKIDGHTTPNDQFFFIQHYNRPEVDGTSWRLKFTGLVNKPAEFFLAELKAMKPTDVVNGYECSGNSGRFSQGLSSCGRFTGVPLSHVLKQVGVGASAREVLLCEVRLLHSSPSMLPQKKTSQTPIVSLVTGNGLKGRPTGYRVAV